MAKQSEFHSRRHNPFIVNAAIAVRRKVYDFFYEKYGDAAKILDVGVTSEQVSAEANMLEKLYPHKERITAVGVEDGSHLETEFPGLKFVRVEPNRPLPFPDNTFDVAFSNAVIEHIVTPEERAFFIAELRRVARAVFLTTPNRHFPIELHTFVPLVHALCPKIFYWALDKGWFGPFYRTSNLSLFSRRELTRWLDSIEGIRYRIRRVKIAGFTTNFVAEFDSSASA